MNTGIYNTKLGSFLASYGIVTMTIGTNALTDNEFIGEMLYKMRSFL